MHGRTAFAIARTGAALAGVFWVAACRSPQAYRSEADNVAQQIVAEGQEEALGHTEPFEVERPADALRRKLMLSQELPGTAGEEEPVTLADPLPLSLIDSLRVGARNSRRYQDRKESVFRSALDLDLESDAFRNTYSGLIAALFSGDESGDTPDRRLTADATAGVTRKLQQGATLSTKIAVDVVKLLTMDESSSLGVLADATISIPLLQGAGREVVTEPLTQAKRDILYALWDFDRFKRSYAVQVASEYMNVLQQAEQVRNAEDNYRMIQITRERAQKHAEAGRLPKIQVGQALQDELRSRTRLIGAQLSEERQLDAFKITLGLATDSRIELDEDEMTLLTTEVGAMLVATETTNATSTVIGEEQATQLALATRLDLRTTRHRYEDAVRRVSVARNGLRSTMNLTASGSLSDREDLETSNQDGETDAEITFDGGRYGAGLEFDLPWERTAERNLYRNSILAADKAARDVEELEDTVKLDVRNALRTLVDAQEAYRIQVQAVDVAERRVESSELLLEAGRAEMRDLLEAQESLVQARNALTAALVAYRIADLGLQRDMGVLEITEEGLWREYDYRHSE